MDAVKKNLSIAYKQEHNHGGPGLCRWIHFFNSTWCILTRFYKHYGFLLYHVNNLISLIPWYMMTCLQFLHKASILFIQWNSLFILSDVIMLAIFYKYQWCALPTACTWNMRSVYMQKINLSVTWLQIPLATKKVWLSYKSLIGFMPFILMICLEQSCRAVKA